MAGWQAGGVRRRDRRRLAVRDAEHLTAFARAAAPLVRQALRVTDRGDGAGRQADRLVEHWRREVVVLSAAAGLGGRITSAAQGGVSAAVQGSLVLCLCGLAGETDPRRCLEVVARTCLDRELPEGWEPGAPPAASAAESPGRLGELARQAWALHRVVDGRAEGRLWHRALANLPVVGAAGVLLGDRNALRVVAAAARAELGSTGPVTAL